MDFIRVCWTNKYTEIHLCHVVSGGGFCCSSAAAAGSFAVSSGAASAAATTAAVFSKSSTHSLVAANGLRPINGPLNFAQAVLSFGSFGPHLLLGLMAAKNF